MKHGRAVLRFTFDLGLFLAATGPLTRFALLAAQNPDASVAESAAAGVRLANAIVDNAVWDTVAGGPCPEGDAVCLQTHRDALVSKIAPARAYLTAGFASHDSTVWLMTASVALSGGKRLAQAGAYPEAFEWLDQLLTELARDSSGHFIAQKQQIRPEASLWFGITDALSLQGPYKRLAESRSCVEVKTLRDLIRDRIRRGVEALGAGRSVAPGVTDQMGNILRQYSSHIDKVGIVC